MSRIVLVTGGGNGLGKAVAARFRAGGDTVIITGRNAGQLASTAAEIAARPITCDATDPQQVTRMAEELGTDLDVVVNMAGGNTDFTHPGGPRADLRQVMMAWRANLDANLLSVIRRSGPPYELTTREITRRTLITPGAVSQRVARAEQAALVERSPSSVSRRAVSVRLTETGHALIENTVRQLLEHEADLISSLSAAERTALTGFLAKLEQALAG